MYIENDGSLMTGKIECEVCNSQSEAMSWLEKYDVATVVYVTKNNRKLIDTKGRRVI